MSAYWDAYSNATNAGQQRTNALANFQTGQRNKRIGNALAGGDYSGAAKTAFGAGDLDTGMQLQNAGRTRQQEQKAHDAAELEKRVTALGKATDVLLTMPEDEGYATRKAAVQSQLIPMLGQIGLNDPQLIDQLQHADYSTQGLQTFRALLGQKAQELQIINGSDGSYTAVDKGTGKPVYHQDGEPKPKGSWKERTKPDGSTEWFYLDETVPAGSPSPGAPQGSGQPRSVRNNNPGNIEDGEFAKSLPGYKGSDGRFAIFETPDAGASAQGRLLQSYGQRGLNTVSAIINRWAPPSENDSAGYARFVAGKLGVSPDQKLDMSNPQVIAGLQSAISQFEGGPASQSNGGQQAGLAAVPGSAPKIDKKGDRKAETDLRKGFNAEPDVKAFNDVAASYDIISRIAKAPPTAANDMSLIFAYMKMLDPGSVVREGEFANAQNTAGIPDQVRNAYNRALTGERLNTKQRTEFSQTGSRIYESRKSRYDQLLEQYRGYAEGYGVNPENVAQARIAAGTPANQSQPRKPKGYSASLPKPQLSAAMRFKGAKAEAGSSANPYVPASEAEYNNLPSGAHYIHRNGQIKVKP